MNQTFRAAPRAGAPHARAVTAAAFVVGVATYLLLPDSGRVTSRLATACNAGLLSALAAGLTPWGAALFNAQHRRVLPSLVLAASAFLLGRIMATLDRWELDWPGMWYFFGYTVLLWLVVRPARAE